MSHDIVSLSRDIISVSHDIHESVYSKDELMVILVEFRITGFEISGGIHA